MGICLTPSSQSISDPQSEKTTLRKRGEADGDRFAEDPIYPRGMIKAAHHRLRLGGVGGGASLLSFLRFPAAEVDPAAVLVELQRRLVRLRQEHQIALPGVPILSSNFFATEPAVCQCQHAHFSELAWELVKPNPEVLVTAEANAVLFQKFKMTNLEPVHRSAQSGAVVRGERARIPCAPNHLPQVCSVVLVLLQGRGLVPPQGTSIDHVNVPRSRQCSQPVRGGCQSLPESRD